MEQHLAERQNGVGRRQRKPESRPNEILEAAAALFARQGFARTTTRQIAREAGISEGTIYKYFSSKHDLLFSFIRQHVFDNLPVLFTTAETSDDYATIRGVVEDRFRLLEENRNLLTVVVSEAFHNPELAAGWDQMVAAVLRLLEEHLQRRVEAGAFRPLHARVAARALLGMVLAYFIKWDVLGQDTDPIPRAEVIDELTAIFVYGVCRRADGASGIAAHAVETMEAPDEEDTRCGAHAGGSRAGGRPGVAGQRQTGQRSGRHAGRQRDDRSD